MSNQFGLIGDHNALTSRIHNQGWKGEGEQPMSHPARGQQEKLVQVACIADVIVGGCPEV